MMHFVEGLNLARNYMCLLECIAFCFRSALSFCHIPSQSYLVGAVSGAYVVVDHGATTHQVSIFPDRKLTGSCVAVAISECADC